MPTLSARNYSEEQIDAIEGIVDDSNYLDSKSDFIRVTSEYALFKNIDGYEPTVDNFSNKVEELGLETLEYDEMDYFDVLTTVHSLTEDSEIDDEECRERLNQVSEEMLLEDFEDTAYVAQRLE